MGGEKLNTFWNEAGPHANSIDGMGKKSPNQKRVSFFLAHVGSLTSSRKAIDLHVEHVVLPPF